MPILTAQVSIPHDSALPEDAVVNTFHFETLPGATTLEIDAAYGAIAADLLSFYNTISAPGTASIRTFLANSLNATAANLKIYDRSDPPPRAPRYNAPLAIAGTGSSALPAEVALCLSYQAARVSGSPQANRRGRLFLGPWTTATNESGTGGVARPTVALRNALAGAATALITNSADTAPWSVFSRVLNSAEPVTDGWVDDAWDIQRRRGERASARLLWT